MFISLFFLGSVSAFAAGEENLKYGIAQYNEENYEEAIEILAKVREREPASSEAASKVNSKHTHSHDSFVNSFSVSPGYNFGRFAMNLNASYTNVLLRTDPDITPAADSSPGYKQCLDYTSVGPAFRMLLNQTNILELFAGYDKKEYYNQKKRSKLFILAKVVA